MAREALQRAVIVAPEGTRVRFTLYLAEAGKRLQLASGDIDAEAARVVHADLDRILARLPRGGR